MQFTSNNNGKVFDLSFGEAVLSCGVDEGGILLPANPGRLPSAFINNLSEMRLDEIAYGVMSGALGDELPADRIKQIVNQVFSFPIPLVHVSDTTYRLELFHGPTRTHKDAGAMMLCRMTDLFAQGRPVRIITSVNEATARSLAVAMKDLSSNVSLIMILPHKPVHRDTVRMIQSLHPGAMLIQVNCDRRKCDALVRQIVSDNQLRNHSLVTTANAMNPAVLLVRTIFFFQAYGRLLEERRKAGYSGNSLMDKGVVFVIPDSNPALSTAARMAADMGLPIKRTIIMPESRMARYGRFLEEGELSVAMAPFPAAGPVTGVTVSLPKIPPTVPALVKHILSVHSSK